MAVNKVIYNGRTLIDLSNDTVSADVLREGETAHMANGVIVTGTMKSSEEFIPLSITFETNKVTEANGSDSIITTFNSDGTITEVRKIKGVTKTIKTTFNGNGSISNTIT